MSGVKRVWECQECEATFSDKKDAVECCEVQRDVDPEDTEDNPWLL